MDERDWLAEQFEEHRSRLRGVAYRMLGSLSDADDAVQEAWLRLSRTDADEIENLGGWLTTVVARVSLNMLRSRRTRREEPLVRVPGPIIARAEGVDPDPWGGAARPRAGADHRPRRRSRSRARGAARGLGWPRDARRARDAVSAGAGRFRAARHLRYAIRRDRADRRALTGGGAPARQSCPAPRPWGEHGFRPGHPASAASRRCLLRGCAGR